MFHILHPKHWWHALASVLLTSACSLATAAPTAAGSLLITDLDAGTLTEYTRQGDVVQTFSIPGSTLYFADLRDVVQGNDGLIHMYNGTFTPSMSTLDPSTGVVSNLTMPGWSTVNNISYGGIAVQGRYVFVSDMFTYGGGEADGIVRFDLSNGSAMRFAEGDSFEDLTLGLDGLLYADYSVYDPHTMSLVRTFSLEDAGDVRGMAVDAAGIIYTASWGGVISKHSASGSLLASLSTDQSLTDLDINASGDIVVGSRFGTVYLTDSELTGFTSFHIGDLYFGPTVHVAFTSESEVPEPSTHALVLVGLALIGLLLTSRRDSTADLVSSRHGYDLVGK